MSPAWELFLTGLLFPCPAFFPPHRGVGNPKSLRRHAASALPETKNPLPLKSDRGQRVEPRMAR